MDNRLKFRAWDKKEKRYRTDGQLQLDDDGDWTYYVQSYCGCGSGCSDEWLGESRIDLEWYTGRKDKNDKELFEKDVIRQEREDSIPLYNCGVIVYAPNRACYLVAYFKKIPKRSILRTLAKGGDVITDVSGDYLFGELRYWPFEITGTIHDEENEN